MSHKGSRNQCAESAARSRHQQRMKTGKLGVAVKASSYTLLAPTQTLALPSGPTAHNTVAWTRSWRPFSRVWCRVLSGTRWAEGSCGRRGASSTRTWIGSSSWCVCFVFLRVFVPARARVCVRACVCVFWRLSRGLSPGSQQRHRLWARLRLLLARYSYAVLARPISPHAPL